jgi:protein SCO1/2
MTKPQKILTTALWIVAVALMLGVLALKNFPPPHQSSAQSSAVPADSSVSNPALADTPAINAGEVIAESPSDALTPMGPVPPFSLINQDKRPTTSSDLLGKPWVADFIFTTCATSCPLMSAKMMDLQKQLPDQIKLVSFTVDPERDTPPVLKQYAVRYQAQDGRWIFLTGDPKTEESVVRGLKLIFSPATADQPISHDEHFVLIDSTGQLRGYYRMDNIDKLIHDAQVLLQQGGTK